MKLKLSIIFLFAVFGLQAQKQIQPYNFSVSKDGVTETIFIYATAKASNHVTFKLKNAKNEMITNDKGEIQFEVFPFSEVSFRKNLVEAILSIDENSGFNLTQNLLKPINEKIDENQKEQLTKRKIAVQDIRNIYQFFNALISTAFEYDTEPVAGLLKYKLNEISITKKTIEGFDTEVYFKKQAKFLRDEILKLDKTEKKYKGLAPDAFMDHVLANDNFNKYFTDFNQNTRNNEKRHDARVVFKHHATEKLKEIYNNYKIEKLFDENLFFEYYNLKEEFVKQRNELNKIKEEINIEKNNIKKLETSLKEKENALKNASNINDKIKKNHESKQKIVALIKENDIKIKKNQTQLDKYKILEQNPINQDKENTDEEQKQDENGKLLANYINILEEIIKNLNNENTSLNSQLEKIKNVKENEPQGIVNLINELETSKNKLKLEIKSSKSKIELLNPQIKDKSRKITIIQNTIDELISQHRNTIINLPLWKFNASDIEIDINDGFIEHITVVGNISTPKLDVTIIRKHLLTSKNDINNKQQQNSKDILNKLTNGYLSLEEMFNAFYEEESVKIIQNGFAEKELKFENEYPIGFSSKTDYADLSSYYLYSLNGYEKTFSMRLSDVLSLYVQRHQNDRLDFSPKDQVVSLPLHDINKNFEIELKKETSSKILSAKVFTDFNGFQEEAENGLLQVEIDKQVPIWTKRHNLGLGRSSNFGFINYANFNFSWQKINEDDRVLQVKKDTKFINNEIVTDNFVTYLDLIKHENISVGVDLNIASFDFPLVKTRLELNIGAHYGRVMVVDDVVSTSETDTSTTPTREFEKTLNIIRVYPDIMFWIRPDERFGGYLRFRPFKTIAPNNDKFFVTDSKKGFVEQRSLDKHWLHRYEFSGFFRPSADSDNKFFFRYRYTNTSTWETNGYSEVQVGYLLYLKF
ncbi:hypothetical protein [Psychroserpens sp. S379A]|uniref:hypothetical protein n=1 Tax=Psychroserpens sp. S379A TaxID=3415137 RepID=UPI003C7A2886